MKLRFRKLLVFGTNTILRKFATGLVSFALFLVVGGPWTILQAIAWGKMVVDYSRQSSVTEAVSKTFDGNHPCSLCKKISKVRDQERKSTTVIFQVKKEKPFISVKNIELSLPEERKIPLVNLLVSSYPVLRFQPAIPVPKA